MSKRGRFYLMLDLGVGAVFALGRFGDDWSQIAFYGASAGVIAVASTIGMFWVEMAHDGAIHRRPRR